jgi:predicted DNA-binding transcriptional regulator AlpA
MKFPSPQPENDNGSLWDAKDVAVFLKVSRSWVYHRAEAGLFPCVRIALGRAKPTPTPAPVNRRPPSPTLPSLRPPGLRDPRPTS